ncbi:hypothetical protein TgHK011_009693 [Trichoderma gracile]|nr:hypothetical protein TgHK011_009693 [Trichoderma gracile]
MSEQGPEVCASISGTPGGSAIGAIGHRATHAEAPDGIQMAFGLIDPLPPLLSQAEISFGINCERAYSPAANAPASRGPVGTCSSRA